MASKIKFMSALAICASLLLSCEQETPPSIEITSSTPVAVACEGGDFVVNYTLSNPVEGFDVVPSTTSEWITDLAVVADGVAFKVLPNATFDKREGVVTLAYEGIENVDVKVIQAASPKPNLIISPQSVEAAASGGDYKVSYILENPVEGAELTVTSDVEWVSASVSTYSIDFTVAANEIEEIREAVVTVEYPGVEPVQVTITQEAKVQEVQTIPVTITEAELMTDYGDELEIWFYEGNNESYVFDVLVGLENGVLPDGTYSIEAGTMSKRYCIHANFSAQGKIKVATLTVSNTAEGSTFDIDWVYEDVNYTIDWTGVVTGFDYSNIK